MKQWKLVAGLAAALMAVELQAQPHELDAAASDPRTMGWMVGFPPPPERLIAPPPAIS